MASTNEIKALFVDGQLTVETKDVTDPTSPLPLTTFTTTELDYAPDLFRPGFRITYYKNKGSSSDRQLHFSFIADEDRVAISYYETLTTESGPRPYDYVLIESSATVDRIEITPTKHRYAITDFRILAKSRQGNETREITGRGHLFIYDLSLPG
ncbi:hypothetical protein ACYZTX_24985 [Pseudomonas sp. MDT1-17]